MSILNQCIALIYLSIITFQNFFHLSIHIKQERKNRMNCSRRNPFVLYKDFAYKYVKLNTLLKMTFDESKDIFDESKFLEIPDYVLWRFGKQVSSFKYLKVVHMDELVIKSLYFDRKSDYTLISHSFNLLEIQGIMRLGSSENLDHQFVLEIPRGTLNASRKHRRPYYEVCVDKKFMTVSGHELNAHYAEALGAFVDKYVKKTVLQRKVEDSFHGGFARTLDEGVRVALHVVPDHFQPNDWFTGKCEGERVTIAFPSVDVGQLRVQLNNKVVDYVHYEYKGNHMVTKMRFTFDNLRLTTDLTVNVSGSVHSATNVDFDLERLQIDATYCAPTRVYCPRNRINVDAKSLTLKTYNQFDAGLVSIIIDEIRRCIYRTIYNGLELAIAEIDPSARGTENNMEYSTM